jgi:hypothetical protein
MLQVMRTSHLMMLSNLLLLNFPLMSQILRVVLAEDAE